MNDDIIEITLVQHEQEQRVGPVDEEQVSVSPLPSSDIARDGAIIEQADKEAIATGLLCRIHNESKTSILKVPHYGGFASVHEFWSYITYAGPYLATLGVAAGGGAAFIRNSLGALNEWRNLRRGRSVNIKVNGINVAITDGAKEADVLAAIEIARKS